ncbi:hypothetical protein Tco_1231516 [Tanacetum coccineum]
MADKETKSTLIEFAANDQTYYYSGITSIIVNGKNAYELKGKFLDYLHKNAFSGTHGKDVVKHIKYFLKIVDPIDLPNVNQDKLRVVVFLISLAGDAWRWFDRIKRLITSWVDLTANFFRKYHTPSRTGKFNTPIIKWDPTNPKDYSKLGKDEIEPTNEETFDLEETDHDDEQEIGPHYTKDCPLKEEGKTLEEAYYTQFGAPFQKGDIEQLLWDSTKGTMQTFVPRTKAIYGRNPKQIYEGESAKRHEENSNLIKEIRALRKINKVYQERGFGSLPSSTETNPRDHVKSISTIVETDSYPIRRIGFSHYAVSTKQNRTLMYETKQTTIPFLSRLNGYYYEEKKGSYGSQFSKSHSEASHVNNSIPKKEKDTRRLGDLAHTKLAVELADKSMKYPKGIVENVLVGLRKNGNLILKTRLIGETLVLNRSLDPFFEDYIELNDLNVPLELRRDQVDDLMPTIKECEVVEEFRARNNAIMDSKIFGYPNFAVLEDMDAYRDEGMGDVIFGKPFLREVGINAKWFEGMITINNGNEEDTYQMAWSHPRFKYHTNEQCNKILTLLKVLAESKEIDEVGEDKMGRL